MPRFLHVANGSSVTHTLAEAGVPGRLSIWADPLHDGPVPGGLSDDALLEVRRSFHEGPQGSPSDDPVNDLRLWRRVIEEHDNYDELVLWFEHDLFDQLNLIQVLSWIHHRVPSSKAVSLICIGSFPGRPDFKGLGELTPAELAPLLDARQPVTESQYALAERAWSAFREATPQALDDLTRSDTAGLPYLAPALVRLLQEYPWTTDGLSRTERRLLRLAEAGSITLSAAFPRMHADESAYYVTDTSLVDLVETLSRTSPPLLTHSLPAESTHEWFRASVTITPAGRAVLRGDQDRVSLCGVNRRWLGGVELNDEATLWRWDDGRQRIISSDSA
jgi:hypothetical protein